MNSIEKNHYFVSIPSSEAYTFIYTTMAKSLCALHFDYGLKLSQKKQKVNATICLEKN